ncbi:S24 family peptidase [Acinetobacter ursingii]|uniref:S24 family peptidase n=1 Tax=Acinetobacter ursingii TaxID=108980 RepID=UPI00124CB31C|nr:helix-turn-helix transcriptional regulator [Acinetobacter ursingii]
MKTLAERLRYAMEVLPPKKIKGVDLARAVGVKPPSVSDWLSGKSKTMEGENLLRAANHLGVNPVWLATGSGNPEIGGIEIIQKTQVEEWDDNTPLDPDEVEIVFFKDLKLACGCGSFNEALESESRRLRVSRKTLERLGIYRDRTFASTTEDDSMKPTINDGDTVYVDQNRNKIKDGKIFALEHGGLFRCKRLYNVPGGGVRIVSDNKDEYPEEILTPDQMIDQGFRVIGWIWKIDHLESW